MARANDFDGPAANPRSARQNLAIQMTILKDRSGYSVRALARALPSSTSSVWRYLNGKGTPDEAFINSFCIQTGATVEERRKLLKALKIVQDQEREHGHRRHVMALGVTAAAVAVTTAGGGAWYISHEHHHEHCEGRPVYVATAYGNVLDEAGVTIGVVDKDYVFVRDVSGAHNRKNRFFGTVRDTKVTGYVLSTKLDFRGYQCITKVDDPRPGGAPPARG